MGEFWVCLLLQGKGNCLWWRPLPLYVALLLPTAPPSPPLPGPTPWPQALLGGITNVMETLKNEGVPSPAIRAVAGAALRYVDGELLNALLMRRDCCSVSAAKVGSSGGGGGSNVLRFL